MNENDMEAPPHTIEIAGRPWHSWTSRVGPWSCRDFPDWEILGILQDGHETYSVFNGYAHHTTVASAEIAARYIADRYVSF